MVFFFVLVGWIIFSIGLFLIIIDIFFESILWGLVSIIFSPLIIIFIVKHFDEVKNKFYVTLIGFVMIIIGKLFEAHIF